MYKDKNLNTVSILRTDKQKCNAAMPIALSW